MSRSTVFLSYSHADEPWKDRLVDHLQVLEVAGELDLWDDRRLKAGDEWQSEIEHAIDAASVAVLLISARFLTSPFIREQEVPRLLERRTSEGIRVIPVLVKPCVWNAVDWLRTMQLYPRDARPLSAGDDHQVDADLAALAGQIHRDLTADPEADPGPMAVASRARIVREVLNMLRTDVPGVALLEPSGFGARAVVKRITEALRKPMMPVRLVPDWRQDDPARLYRTLFRDLRRGLERELGRPLPAEWSKMFPSPETTATEQAFDETLEDLLDGPVTTAGRTLVLVVEGLSKALDRKAHLESWARLISRLAGDRPLKVVAWGGQELYDLCTGYTEVRDASPFQQLARLELGLLTPEEVERLASDHPAPSAELHRVTGGHPALLDELLRHPEDNGSLPARVLASAHLRRLRRELERATEVLQELRRLSHGDMSRRNTEAEQRLRWHGILVEDGPIAWRWAAPVMEGWLSQWLTP
ncbi:MAG: toll/interleukin-1 receptor domain-containing protein [bacterium]|nr:toll/interleukin-1 receptor domain-containing protein [bacterium]